MTPSPASTRGRSALLLGATGLVGSHCLDLLLADDAYATVRVLARRPPRQRHAKLDYHEVDFDRLAAAAALFRVDDLFCALGTTIAKAGSREAFRRVDHDYPVRAAELGVEAGAARFLVVSALGADAGSRIFYNRVKGEMEERVRALPYRAVWVLRPGLLLGERAEPRRGERIATALYRPLTPLLVGPLRRYRPVAAADVARAMVELAKGGGAGGVVESEEIAAVVRRAPA